MMMMSGNDYRKHVQTRMSLARLLTDR